MDDADTELRQLSDRSKALGWSTTALSVATVASAITSDFESNTALWLGGLLFLALVVCGLAYLRTVANYRAYAHARDQIAAALESDSSHEIMELNADISRAAHRSAAIDRLQSRFAGSIESRLARALNAEALRARTIRVAELCDEAKRLLAEQVATQRLASPAIRAQKMITEAIARAKQLREEAERQLDAQREKLLLKWWFDLTRPSFEEIDIKIAELEAAKGRLIASGQISRTEQHYDDLSELSKQRIEQIKKDVISIIPSHHDDEFDDRRIVQHALMLSALSIPISAWRDISQAGDVYESLREVNGNYADMMDAEIWLDTLLLSGPQLAGLAALTKGAYFEALVEGDFGGERFEHFNHPDTDIVVDGVAYQIKATDSVDYIESVPDDIPVISTSEIADLTGSIDGGYTNEELTDVVDLAIGGTVVDISDTALDAVFTGIGGVGVLAIIRGVRRASARFRETGDAIASLFEGLSATATATAKTTVNAAELATKSVVGLATSKPAKFTGRVVLSSAKALGRRFERWEEGTLQGPNPKKE